MTRLVFMVEERSMRELLSTFLPRILPSDVEVLLITHEGKSDLERSLERKLRGWRRPDDRFIVLRDKDGADCVQLKSRLSDLCQKAGRPDTLVRIVVHHLESWFLGDLVAVECAFGRSNLSGLVQKERYRNPDSLANAKDILAELVPEYQKCSGARAIGSHISVDRSTSPSFRTFVSGLAELIAA